MTFRSRVVIATSAAVAVAVALLSATSFIIARHAVIQSVDESLRHVAQQPQAVDGGDDHTQGSGFALVLADGTIYAGHGFSVSPRVVEVARKQLPAEYITTTVGTISFRQLVVPIAKGSAVYCSEGICTLAQNGAQVFSADITGQRHQLGLLGRSLVLVAFLGVLLASLLGYVAAQRALVPLEEVTEEIEEIAATSDMGRRISDGGDDELGRLRRTFNKLMDSVDKSQTLQRQLVMDASHELRTPLTSLRTNAQVLSNIDRLDPEDRSQIVDDMLVQIQELSTLITDLGELTRGERSEGTVEVLRLDEIVEDAVGLARTHARTKDIEIDFESSPSTIEIRRDRLERAIANLLSNAVKFTPIGGRVSVSSADGAITVEDSGPGIVPDERAHIFDRFWRSAGARALPGSGLGLAIVAQVVTEAHGTITVSESERLGGARFTISLPTINQE